jgi:hypothetical protein
MKGFDSEHVRWAEATPVVATVTLPDGVTIPLTAEELVTATIVAHPNSGRSKITVGLTVELEVGGAPDVIRANFARALLAAIRDRDATIKAERAHNENMRHQVRDLTGELKAAQLRASIDAGSKS